MISNSFWYTLPLLVCVGCGSQFTPVASSKVAETKVSQASVSPATSSTPNQPSNVTTSTPPACVATSSVQSAVQGSLGLFRLAQQNRFANAIATGCINAIQDKMSYMNQWGWACDLASQAQTYAQACTDQVQNMLHIFNTDDCAVTNGKGIERWGNTGWGACQVTSCNSGFTLLNNQCAPVICSLGAVRSCSANNANGTQSCMAQGTAWDSCSNFTNFSPGFQLRSGQSVAVAGGSLVYTADGVLALASSQGTLWASPTANQCSGGIGACTLAFQSDGNLVLYNQAGQAYWHSGTAASAIHGVKANLLVPTLQTPFLKLQDSQGNILWSANDIFPLGFTLAQDHFVQIHAGGAQAFLYMQGDGNVVVNPGVYDPAHAPGTGLWASNSVGQNCNGSCSLILQGDGNLVMSNQGLGVWSSVTSFPGQVSSQASQVIFSARAPYIRVKDANAQTLWDSSGDHNTLSTLPALQIPSLPGKHRITVRLDDNSTVLVDNASSMSDGHVNTLVLAADRSTVTGCPFDVKRKGLMQNNDRIFVSNHYIAWFSLTPGSTYSRSGALTGLWTLNPDSQNFRYMYGGQGDSAQGICANWAHNELIPGSNSPGGQTYWWDRYAPPVEHTINLRSINGASADQFYSSVYTQLSSNGQFEVSADGAQDVNGVHYATRGWMGNMAQKAQFQDAGSGEMGHMWYSLEFNCREQDIEVQWKFSPSVTAVADNVFVSAWLAYPGLTAQTCYNSDQNYPVPGTIFSSGGPRKPYQFIRSNLPLQLIDGPIYNEEPDRTQCSNKKTLTQTVFSYASLLPNSVVVFPWQVAVPGNPHRLNVDVNASPQSTVSAWDWLAVGDDPAFGVNIPKWRMLNFQTPDTGSGTFDDPYGFPFTRMVYSYENGDQTFSLNMARGPYGDSSRWYTLQSNRTYQVHYSLSTAF